MEPVELKGDLPEVRSRWLEKEGVMAPQGCKNCGAGKEQGGKGSEDPPRTIHP